MGGPGARGRRVRRGEFVLWRLCAASELTLTKTDPLTLMRERVLQATQAEADEEVADLDEVDDLAVYGADEDSSGASEEPQSRSTGFTLARSASAPLTAPLPPPPSEPPPPPPDSPPPPPPLDPPPPPPLPPSATALLHLVDYRTALLDSRTHWVAWRAADAHEALARVPPGEELLRRRVAERERAARAAEATLTEDEHRSDGEQEMDLGSGSSDGDRDEGPCT